MIIIFSEESPSTYPLSNSQKLAHPTWNHCRPSWPAVSDVLNRPCLEELSLDIQTFTAALTNARLSRLLRSSPAAAELPSDSAELRLCFRTGISRRGGSVHRRLRFSEMVRTRGEFTLGRRTIRQASAQNREKAVSDDNRTLWTKSRADARSLFVVFPSRPNWPSRRSVNQNRFGVSHGCGRAAIFAVALRLFCGLQMRKAIPYRKLFHVDIQ